jgi:hypothetical protein
MPELDFRKVVSILGRTLDMSTDFDIARGEAATDNYTVTFTHKDGSAVTCRIVQGNFRIMLEIARKAFDAKKFDRWVNSFEYELEQAFKSNIKVTVDEDPVNYRITVAT